MKLSTFYLIGSALFFLLVLVLKYQPVTKFTIPTEQGRMDACMASLFGFALWFATAGVVSKLEDIHEAVVNKKDK